MKKIFTLLASTVLVVTPLTTACTPASSGGGGVVSTPGTFDPSAPISIPLKVKEAYRTALQAAIGINRSVDLAVDAGLIKPGSPDAVKIADLLQTMKGVIDAIHTAYRAGNTDNLVTRITELTSLVTQISVLIAAD